MVKKGFIHRNILCLHNRPYRFTVPLNNVSQNKLIMDTFTKGLPDFYTGFKETLHHAYRNCDFYSQLEEVLSYIDFSQDTSIARLSEDSIKSIARFLDLKVQLIPSSSLPLSEGKAQQRIINICKELNTDTYHNLPSGKDLYDHNVFLDNGMCLKILDIDKKHFSVFLSEDEKPLSIDQPHPTDPI